MQLKFINLLYMTRGVLLFFGLLISGQLNVQSPDNQDDMKTTNYSNTYISAFLENPTAYNFLCTETSHGEVLKAILSTDGKLTIHYKSTWDDGDHSGIAFGQYNTSTHRFDGRYKTNDNRFEGEINFTFSETGEAQGTWDHGYGTIRIPLKNSR